MPRERTEAQIQSELRREERAKKTLVRHTPESIRALAKLRKKLKATDPEVLRAAVIDMARRI
jgi:hypothetical protein